MEILTKEYFEELEKKILKENYSDFFGDILEDFKKEKDKFKTEIIDTGQIFYRARVGNGVIEAAIDDLDIKCKIPYFGSDMEKPPAKFVQGGRFNRQGVSYLYLADNIETCIAEIHLQVGQICSIVEFECVKKGNYVLIESNSEEILYDILTRPVHSDIKDYYLVSVREFQSLFNYNYLNATRLLNDEKTDNYFSISKELLSHFKKSNDWEEFKKQIIKDIKEGLKEQKLNEKVKEHSLIKAQNALDSIEKCFEYNKGEFSLQTDISDELLLGFLSSSLQTFFEFENGTKLKEFSQGLGISNLIFMCLKVEAFVQQYQSDVVDIFVIEEPEAHMHPQMERMLIKFLNEILLNEDNNRVQGIITTHSSEIIKCSDLKNIRVLRIDKLLKSAVYDMNLFKQNLETEEERQFFSFLFSINYSDLIFANKVIMYEGDTEKLYIEKLLAEKEFEGLSNQYVSFVQVGGAYTHWYRKLVYFLKIKTLIITDIDYCKKLTSIDEIKDDDGITNAGLIQYYKDYVTVNIIKRDILPYCEHKCRKQLKDCLYEKTEMERISLIQSDFRKKPCPKIKKPDYSIMKKKPTVVDIDSWIKNPDCELIKVVSQGEADAYTRTLEEAMLCKLLGITVESKKSSDWWEKQISINKIKLDIPTRKKNITVRDILNENKNNKTDFMYSIILSELHLKALPNYIREGLIWLM